MIHDINFLQQEAKAIAKNVDFDELSKKKFLITGASGLIGLHIINCLSLINAKEQIELFAVMKNRPEKYLEKFFIKKKIKYFVGDISSYKFIKQLPKANYIIHAAGYGQPKKFMEDPIKTIQINTNALISLVEKLVTGGKFLFISSSEVYSGLKKKPFLEDQIGTTTTSHPRACYIESKRCGEAICLGYKSQGIDIKVARVALAYGPGTKIDDKRVLYDFIAQALQKRIELIDDGKAYRTYCYITDAVSMILNILLYGKKTIYNVGGKSHINIAELAQKIGEILKAEVIIPKQTMLSLGAPDDVQVDVSRYEKEFGKIRFVKLEDGLKRTIAWQSALFRGYQK